MNEEMRQAYSRLQAHEFDLQSITATALFYMPARLCANAWLASMLGVNPGYISRVLRDLQPMPRLMFNPIAYATGSHLILQYDELQLAVRARFSELERGNRTAGCAWRAA